MKKTETEKYAGLLDGYFETGSEGTYWVLDIGKDVPIFIDRGDHLKVFGEDDKIVFDGRIVPDFKAGWKHYLGHPDPKAGQQAVFGGWWVHWIQKGWDPDDWGKLFIKHWFKQWRGAPQHRAELTKKKKPR